MTDTSGSKSGTGGTSGTDEIASELAQAGIQIGSVSNADVGWDGGPVNFRRPEYRGGKVPVSTKIFQGFGALPGQHKEWAFNTLLLLYYSQILGLPATYASTVLGIALFLDAMSDPLVGAYSDNFRSKMGRRHPFMFGSIVPTALAAFFLFAPPHGMPNWMLVGWMLIFTVLMRFFYTFFAVPWNAVAAELSEDYGERTSIITYRMVIGWLGGVLFTFAMYSLVFHTSAGNKNGLLDASRYFNFAIILAVLMALWMTITSVMTRNQVRYLPQPVGAVKSQAPRNLLRQAWMALHSRHFRLPFSSVRISAGVAGTAQVFDIYMNLYFWGLSPENIRWFSLAIIGAIASFVTAGLLQKYFEKQQIMVVSIFLLMILAMGRVILRFVDVLPQNGDPALVWFLVIYVCFMAYFWSMILIMFASMIPDIVDEQEFDTGLRQEGVFSAGISFAGKATTSVGLIIGGMLLDLFIQFPRGAAPADVGSHTIFLLGLTDGILVPVLNIGALFLLMRYSLTPERLAKIQAELKRRADRADV